MRALRSAGAASGSTLRVTLRSVIREVCDYTCGVKPYIRKVSNRPVKYKKATYQPHTDAVHADALAMRAQSLPQLDGGTHSTEVHVQPPLVGGVKAIQLVLADHAASRVLHRERACRHVESHLGTVSSVLHSSHPPRCSSTSPPTLHVDLKLCSALYRNLNRTKGGPSIWS